MLSKEICKQCILKHEESLEGFEEDWQENRIGCPKILVVRKTTYKGKDIDLSKSNGMMNLFGTLFGLRNIEKLPPPWCPYELEHQLEDQEC